MAAGTSFENLQVYRLGEKPADEVWTVVTGWEQFAKATVGRQMVRAADSVGANIAEGSGRISFQDNRHFVRMARGSLNETKHWLRRAHRGGFMDSDTFVFFLFLVIWVGWTWVNARIAARRGVLVGGVVLISLLLSPLVGMIGALYSKADPTAFARKMVAKGQRQCPDCRQWVPAEASVCYHCRHQFSCPFELR
jgi:four helix bundle protein